MKYTEEERDRFYSFVRPSGDGCLVWRGQFDGFGYGLFWVQRRARLASEVAWEMAKGSIPEGMTALPECDLYACVRADHLCLEPRHSTIRRVDPSGPITTDECAFILYCMDGLGSTERVASRALGGMHISAVRQGLWKARAAAGPRG
jgi:hypothetical protein